MTLPTVVKIGSTAATAPALAGVIFTDDHVQLVALVTAAVFAIVTATVGVIIWVQKQVEKGRQTNYALIIEVRKDLSSLHDKLDDVRFNGCARACHTLVKGE